MRKAVNYAIDRTTLASLTLPYAATPTDQYLPPGDPGYGDIDAYPMHPDLVRARELADWQPGDPLRTAVLYYRTSSSDNQQQAQELHDELLQIGIDATMVGWAGGDIYFRMGHRGEPFDLAVSVGWCGSWFDPWDYAVPPGRDDDPRRRREPELRLLQRSRLQRPDARGGGAHRGCPLRRVQGYRARPRSRRRAVGGLAHVQQQQHLLEADRVPTSSSRVHLDRICSRSACGPEITTDDMRITEPPTGTSTVHVPVHLSSEMDNTVTVDYATADGTAHAGEDYVATSGTLTFAPHERAEDRRCDDQLGRRHRARRDVLPEPVEREQRDDGRRRRRSSRSPRRSATATATSTATSTSSTATASTSATAAAASASATTAASPATVRCSVPRVIGMRLAAAKSKIRRAALRGRPASSALALATGRPRAQADAHARNGAGPRNEGQPRRRPALEGVRPRSRACRLARLRRRSARSQPSASRVRGEPRLGRLPQAAHLLRRDHLERIAPLRAAFRLHLAEDDRPAAAQHEVELVAADPDVRRQHAVAAEPVVPQRAPLGARPDRARTRRPRRAGLRLLLHSGSRAPGTSGGGCRTGRARGRAASGAA